MGLSGFIPPEDSALIVVDVQNDFCPGGSLAVVGGDVIIPSINEFTRQFLKHSRPIFFTRDWHKPDAQHFKNWPVHCVQETLGAAFHPALFVPQSATIITKGDGGTGDAYSGFEGHDTRGLYLADILSKMGVRTVYVGGLATDYCVKATVMDALLLAFNVQYLMTCSRPVNLKPGDGKAAEDEMAAAGAGMLLG